MQGNRTALMFVMVAVMLLAAVPFLSDDAEGSWEGDYADVRVSLSPTSVGDLKLHAGDSTTVRVHLVNTVADVRCIEFIGSSFSRGSVSVAEKYIELEPDGHYSFLVDISVDRYSRSVKDVSATVSFEIYDPYDDSNRETYTLKKIVHISSGRASEDQFNMVMGLIDNPLPAPFDVAIYAAGITFLIWLMIATIVALGIIPRVIIPIVFRRKSKDKRKALGKKIKWLLFIMILLHGINVCVAVMGASEMIISNISLLTNIAYILFGASIVWKLFSAILDVLSRRDEEDEPDDSLRPLFLMIGKIVIGMVIVAALLGVFGADMMIIATGAGIVGLAISFGAQSTLAQFFSGFTLLINRPFRPGDLIRLDAGTDILIVMNVGLMMTTFRNWANSEIFSMPNQKVVNSTIVNVTAESLAYRIIVLVRVPYGTDVKLAKKLALEAMTEHPRILQDGSEEIPKARLEDFSESALTIRVSGFVDDFDDHRSIAGEIREGIYTKFRENDVAIAIPKMDVYIRDPAGGNMRV